VLSVVPTPAVATSFHPAVAAWFANRFGAPTPAQAQAWPSIQAGRNTLIAAPTGSGKTLAAFLAAIDLLVREAADGCLRDETQIVYVSPLKALSNDIQRNLEEPLAGIRETLRAQGLPDADIRAWVRTGDTPATERARMRRRPPHIVVTTPESLYILLGSESGRQMLATTRTVIVDEIHALAPNKRGAHLALSLERLDALCARKLLRIGLSATQKPIETVASFLIGADAPDCVEAANCEIIYTGHIRSRDLALEIPASPLEAVMSAEVWLQIYNRLAELATAHRTTLVFVNTRRMAERVARQLSDRLGEDQVAAHHGSMAKELRLDAEQRLKRGALKLLVATASLELGIDIGDVDLVCQLGSPRSIASFLQRVGRSGHAVGGTPKGRLFPLSRDELVECAALIDSVHRGELDRLTIPEQPLDVLAQQIAAEVAVQEWNEDALLALFRRSWPYRALQRDDFFQIVRMLAEGFSTRRGRRGALLHHDAVNHMLRERRGARLTALSAGGTIPDTADYQVVLEPEAQTIGSVNEDFAVESMAGDVFQLGNSAYRILRVERGVVRVEDAHGSAPTIPFWLGEAPGRSDELSQSVARLRSDIAAQLRNGADRREDPHRHEELGPVVDWLAGRPGIGTPAAEQLAEYLATAHAALGCLPTQETIVFERFFDEAGGMQLVIHTPYGSRINRAWGLALRKRFCRKFNFELQAAATEDNIVLSLTTAHSFELGDAARYLHSASVRTILIEALLDAPMFTTRWRWVAGTALALPRRRGGKRLAPQLARMEAEDLIGTVFPDQIACAENLAGAREIPDHPLVNQTIADCLTEGMDIAGLECLLRRLESGEIRVVVCDLTQPSPLALEVLAAKPYAFLDDAPLEERRTQAVLNRRWLTPATAADIGRLDPEAIDRVRAEVWPDPANADELHDALGWIGYLGPEEAAGWNGLLGELARQNRVTRLTGPGLDVWIAAERLAQFQAVLPDALQTPAIGVPDAYADRNWSAEEALVEILRGRLEGQAAVTAAALAEPLGLGSDDIASALVALEVEGFAMRGRFTPGVNAEEWCARRLLARIHQYTIKRLRAEIEPVAARDFLRFLFVWQHVTAETRMEGPDALAATVAQLEGFEAAAGAWESEILPARVADYEPAWLDDACLSGRVTWARLKPHTVRPPGIERGVSPVRTTPITLLLRRHAPFWHELSANDEALQPTGRAQAVAAFIRANGASFFDEILTGAGLLRSQAEEAVAELVALGLVASDSFGGLRTLLVPSDRRGPADAGRRRRRAAVSSMDDAGRWALTRRGQSSQRPLEPGRPPFSAEAVEHAARTLLSRYGVVFWRTIEREADWLPPWRDLLRVFRRLEARGELRGGRFVAGFSGEQFALPDAIGLLRETRRKSGSGQYVSVSGADPLNLIGILTPGPKLPALTLNRLLYRDGLPIAALAGGEVRFYEELPQADQWQVRKALLRGTTLPIMADPAPV
jgi:ATP-dependent Lhr-like helicase